MLAQWQHAVASSEALDLLHREMHTLTYRRIPIAIKMACKGGALVFIVCLPVALMPTGAIQSKYLPDGSIPRLLV
jgi:hypothetical protein